MNAKARIAAILNRSGAGRSQDRALAIRHALPGAKGTGALSVRGPKLLALLGAVLPAALILTLGIASAVASPAPCANDAVRAEDNSTALPDCRAYEMVSPLDKNGGDLALQFNNSSLIQATPDGSKIAYISGTAFDDPKSGYFGQYIATRDGGGWSTENITPAFTSPSGPFNQGLPFKAFSPDLSEGLRVRSIGATEDPPLGGAPEGYKNFYLTKFADDSNRALLTVVPTESPEEAFNVHFDFEGTTADLKHIFIGAGGALTPGATRDEGAFANSLYEWTEGQFQAISVPVGATNGETIPNSALGSAISLQDRTVSDDGSTAFWSTKNGEGNLFARKNVGQPQSPIAHPLIGGRGTLASGSATVSSLVTARGSVELTAGSGTATELITQQGEFLVGQTVSGEGIPPGTTITAASAGALTLSAAATSSGVVSILSEGPAPFVAGEAIKGIGIPSNTTITAVSAGSLTLSNPATTSGEGVALGAGGECAVATDACTVQLDSGITGPGQLGQTGFFLTASTNGERAFFTNSRNEAAGDLYEYSLATERLTDLIPAEDQGGARIQGVLGAGEDGSYVYFAAAGALAPGATAQSCNASCNLYLWHDDGTADGAITYIAKLSSSDSTSAEVGPADWSPFLAKRTARVSPDGRQAIFMSEESLTGYDNTGENCVPETFEGNVSGYGPGRCQEVYLYDAEANEGAGRLTCVSCNPSGAKPIGPSSIPGGAQSNGFAATYAPRALSVEGDRILFNSIDALSPADANGQQDVYEWERPSTGDCKEASGCIGLISTGTAAASSQFVEASENGDDVFFLTRQGILRRDSDSQIDLYDAHANGGFPEPPPAAPPCEGEGCKGAVPPLPKSPSAASAAFSGPGNPKPRHKRHKKKHAKRHHKAKHEQANSNRGGVK